MVRKGFVFLIFFTIFFVSSPLAFSFSNDFYISNVAYTKKKVKKRVKKKKVISTKRRKALRVVKREKSFSLGPDIGFFTPVSKIPIGFYGGVKGVYVLPFLNRGLFTGISFYYGTGKKTGIVYDEKIENGSISYSTRVHVIPLFLEFGVRSPERWMIRGYGGVGVGFVWEKAVEKTEYQKFTQNGSGFGSAVFGGGNVRVGPGFVDLRIGFAYFQEKLSLTGTTQHGGFFLTCGYSVLLF